MPEGGVLPIYFYSMTFQQPRFPRSPYSRIAVFVFFILISGFFFWKSALPALVAVGSWTFDTASDYFYDTGSVSVSGGLASLLSLGTSSLTVNHNDNGSTEFGGGTSSSIQWVSASTSLQITSGVSGTFTSPVIDAGVTTTWQTLSWLPFAPYGKEMVTGTDETVYSIGNFASTGSLVGYWRLNEESWNGTADEVLESSGNGLHGSRRGGANTTGTAQFGRAGSFPLADTSYVYVTSTNFRSADQSGTIMAWIFPTSTGGGTFRHVFASTDESSALGTSNRLVLGLLDNVNQALFYHADGTTFDSNIGNTVMAPNQWHHIAVTNSGAAGGYRLYVDGILQTLTTFGGGNSGDWFADANGAGATQRDNITIGAVRSANTELLFDGLIDEVAVFSQEMTTTTIQDLYRRGAQRLRFQVRSCDDSACSGETFTGIDGTAATYYTESTTTTVGLPSKTLVGIPQNRYFQYQVLFDTTSTQPSPALLSVTTTGLLSATYSSSTPTIGNNTGFSFNNISAFSNVLGGGNQGTIEYQVAVNNTSTWYYYNGANWVTATSGYPNHTNTVGEINSNILQLDNDVSSGVFYFRAFLVSNGTQAVQLDTVSIVTTSSIAFAASSASVNENSGTSTIIIQLDGVSSSTVSVNYAITSGTATATSDYIFTTGTASILSGATTTSIPIYIVDDAIAEGSEVLVITLSSVSGGLLGSSSTYTLTILDNDTPGVTVNPTTVSVTEGASTSSYTIVLDTQPGSSVTMAVTSTGGQITLSTTSITFTTSTWNSPRTVVVTPVDDIVGEGTHTATITHTAVSGDSSYNGIAISNVTTTIMDNDVVGVTIDPTSVSVTEGGTTSSYTAVLGSQPASTVTVTVASTGGDVSLSPTVLTFTTGTWSIPQTVVVTAVDDSVYEGAHSDTITHTVTSADSNYNGVSVSSTSVSVTDNDTAPVSSGGGGSYVFTPAPKPIQGQTPITVPGSNQSNPNAVVESSSRAVPLTFSVDGAVRMALSNRLDFEGAVQEPYRSSVVWDLCGNAPTCGSGVYTVYALFYNVSGIPSSMVTRQIRYVNQGASVPQPARNIELYKTATDPRIFEVKDGVKRWIVNEQAFLALGYKWSDIQVVPNATLLDIPDAGTRAVPSIPVTPPTFRFTTTLSYGMRGDAVQRLQILLTELGFFPKTVVANGNFGPTTRSALQAFQRAKGISAVGYTGPQTRAALNTSLQ